MATSLNLLLNGRSHKTLKTTSIVLIVIGIIGIALPQFLSMAIALFAGWLLLFAGTIAMFITWHGFRDRWVSWLKPFVLVAVGDLLREVVIKPLLHFLGSVIILVFCNDPFHSWVGLIATARQRLRTNAMLPSNATNRLPFNAQLKAYPFPASNWIM